MPDVPGNETVPVIAHEEGTVFAFGEDTAKPVTKDTVRPVRARVREDGCRFDHNIAALQEATGAYVTEMTRLLKLAEEATAEVDLEVSGNEWAVAAKRAELYLALAREYRNTRDMW